MCRKWKQGVKQSMGRRESLSFAGWKMDDDSTARLVRYAYCLKELDMYVFYLCFFNTCDSLNCKKRRISHLNLKLWSAKVKALSH